MTALNVNGVSKAYGSLKALNNVSFDIKEGEMFSLLGPNGSGKTTLISIISSLLQSDEGSIEVFGEKVSPNNLNARRLFGLVPQEIVNHGFFTVEEVLGFVSGYYGLYDNQARIDYLLDRLGLDEHRKKLVRELSGGMKRRLLIAKALLHKPKLLLLDEPTAGVDIELRASMWEFIRELNKEEKMAILLTTHYLEEAEELCERVAIIERGNIRRVGKTKELISELTRREVNLKLSSPVDCSSEYLLKNTDQEISFSIPHSLSVGKLLNELKIDTSLIEDIVIREGSLEEAFLNVLGESKNV